MKIHIGIDPGKTGAVGVLYDGKFMGVEDCPTLKVGIKERPDPASMVRILRTWKEQALALPGKPSLFATLELVGARPGQGVTSMFNFGCNYGMWQGILASLEIPYTLTTPQAWKREMMPGEGKDKDAARMIAVRLFPDAAPQLKLKKHDGRAEALLLAEFGRRKAG